MSKKIVLSAFILSTFILSGCQMVDEASLEAMVEEKIQDDINEKVKTALMSGELDEEVYNSANRYVTSQQQEANKPKEATMEISVDDDAILGDPNAPVTIVEFSDFECPYCKMHFEETFPKIKKKYIDTGLVRYVFRDLPMSFHEPIATLEALAANCAREQGGDSKYYEFHDALFEATESNIGITEKEIYELADTVNIDQDKLEQCIKSEKYLEEVENDMADAASYGVQGTPNFFINQWHIKGAFPYEAFEEYIEIELAK